MARRWRVVLVTTVLAFAAASLVIFQLTPIYSGTALIIVDPRMQNSLEPSSRLSISPADAGRVDSEVEILRSPSMLMKVVEDQKLSQESEYAPGGGLRDRLTELFDLPREHLSEAERVKRTFERFRKATTIERVRLTFLISVTVASRDPEKAAALANALAKAYIDQQVQSKLEVASGAQGALGARLAEARAALRDAETKLDALIEQNIEAVGRTSGRQELLLLRDEISAKQGEIGRLSGELTAARGVLSSRRWDEAVAQLGSAPLASLVRERTSMVSAMSGSQALTGDVDLRASLAALDDRLASETSRVVKERADAVESAMRDAQTLREKLRDAAVRTELPNDLKVRLYEMVQEATATRTIYQSLLSQAKSAETLQTIQVADSRLVSAALPPVKPSFPDIPVALGASFVLSLLAGCGLAYWRDKYVGGLSAEEQVEAALGVSAVASLPLLRMPRWGKTRPADAVVNDPFSAYSEGIRRLRFALEAIAQQSARRNRTKILVTSALPGEGKTQTAISLARSLSQAGRKVLLVDADLRRPSIAAAIGVGEEQSGLNRLTGGIVTDTLTAVTLLFAPERDLRDPVLGMAEIGKTIAEVEDAFDVVVLDTSPLLAVADAQLLVPQADLVLLVVKWQDTQLASVRATLKNLSRSAPAGPPQIAAVLNQVSGFDEPYGEYGRH
jgi:uncharacterized protein involved in exopolysaccharide biosynthesis/Mrp family chromosome partitioning ATPase